MEKVLEPPLVPPKVPALVLALVPTVLVLDACQVEVLSHTVVTRLQPTCIVPEGGCVLGALAMPLEGFARIRDRSIQVQCLLD